MSILLTIYRNRTRDYTLTLLDGAGADFNLAAEDIVRVKVGRGDGTPDLDLSSEDETPAGSSIDFTVATNDVTLRIAQDDSADLVAGVYDLEVVVVDGSEDEGQDVKLAQIGVASVVGTMGGGTTEESSSS